MNSFIHSLKPEMASFDPDSLRSEPNHRCTPPCVYWDNVTDWKRSESLEMLSHLSSLTKEATIRIQAQYTISETYSMRWLSTTRNYKIARVRHTLPETMFWGMAKDLDVHGTALNYFLVFVLNLLLYAGSIILSELRWACMSSCNWYLTVNCLRYKWQYMYYNML